MYLTTLVLTGWTFCARVAARMNPFWGRCNSCFFRSSILSQLSPRTSFFQVASEIDGWKPRRLSNYTADDATVRYRAKQRF